MGPSGSGKSTLTKLLQGFYVPSDGQIKLDGNDSRSGFLRERIMRGTLHCLLIAGIGLALTSSSRPLYSQALLQSRVEIRQPHCDQSVVLVIHGGGGEDDKDAE
nr:ATP-binding cassette domain-containing protein [Collimonas pratensis]